MKNIGKWLLVLAFLLAILGAFVDLSNEYIHSIVVLLAFAGAYMFIEDDKATGWLIMALALGVFAGSLNGLVFIGEYLTDIFSAMTGIFGVAVLAILVKKIVGFFS